MTEDLRSKAIALYDRFTHEGLDRRLFMARMVALAGSVAAAEALIGAIAASPAAAAIVPENDPRLTVEENVPLVAGRLNSYVARPRGRDAPAVLVIHENRGLNAHIKDVARRLALAGFVAYAPDFLTPAGGTPANADAARDAIGKLDMAAAVADAVTALNFVTTRGRFDGNVGAVGFCWGGAFVNRLAVAAGDQLHAGVVFYGPAPDPSEAAKVEAPMQFHLAGLDERVNRTGFPWITALREAGKQATFFFYEDVNHAFHNDTSAERYNEAAAKLAWERTLRFFDRRLS